ncbi:hypothetical protein [Nocardia alni]|uniref:hypothetical protein n=1 Tax=Nocardia alni TaxID=2815723 RepID=UPI001C220A34|nr:hypothetical protein [Nocardia alni]
MTEDVDLAMEIPGGYIALPLNGIDNSLAATLAILKEAGPPDMAQAAGQMIPALGMFLGELASDGVRYCGLGRHFVDDELVTSMLTVLVYDTGGDTERPRIVVKNIADAKLEDGARGDLQVVDIDNRPMMFFEQVRDLPVPDLPGNPIQGAAAPVYQFEAAVPSNDGSAVASIELSTTFAAHGPQYRRMIIDMARSVELKRQKTYGGSLRL